METTSFKERLVAQREQAILETARNMFAEKGFHNTNLNDVAQAVGIARGTIYLHFPTKEELLLAIINQAEEYLLTRLNKAIRPGDDPVAKLSKVLKELLHTYENYGGLIKVMSDDLRRVVAQKLYGGDRVRPLPDFVQRIIEEGKQAGIIKKEINTAVAAYALFSVVTIGTYQELIFGGQVSGEEIARSAVEIYLKGVQR